MNISQDIVDEILSWLPVKSLTRFKVVCKDWYSNIHSHSFIAKHIKNQTTKNKILIYHRRQRSDDIPFVFSICSAEEEEDSNDDLKLFHRYAYDNRQDVMEHVPLAYWKCNDVRIIGTCNGLVCLEYTAGNRVITLWNPAIGDFKTLPKFRPCLRPPGALTGYFNDDVGFGFDRANNDYKVIRMLYFLEKEHRKLEECIVKMEIYTLGTSAWRELDCSGFLTEKIGLSTLIFGEENFCWLAQDFSRKELILSFNMSKEVFQKTPFPSDYEHLVQSDTKLFNLHDSIALVQNRFMEMTFAIWTRKELEQEGNSWIKMSNVGYEHSRSAYPLGFLKCKNSNNFLFLDHPPFGWGSSVYDITGVCIHNRDQIKTARYMKIKVQNDSIDVPLQVLPYVETLVSVSRDYNKSSLRFV